MLETLDSDTAFRELVSEGLAENEPDPQSWLFLTRPDGWRHRLEDLNDQDLDAAEEAASASRLRTTERHLEATRTALAAARSESVELAGQVEQLGAELRHVRSAVAEAERAIVERDRESEDLRIERARAVKSLKASEKLASQRLETIRVLEDRLLELEKRSVEGATTAGSNTTSEPVKGSEAVSEGTGDGVSASSAQSADTADRIDLDALSGALRDATVALTQLTTAFGRASEAVTPEKPAGSPASAGVSSDVVAPGSSARHEDSHVGQRPSAGTKQRRAPIRLQRGALEESPEGLRQILRTPEVLVFVDGYNVAMEAWPTLSKTAQRESLIEVASAIRSRSGAEIHLVFDGVGDGSRPSVPTALPVRVHFSAQQTEADDLILELLQRSQPRPALVISSDRRVQDGARRAGANVVSSAQMIAFSRRNAH